ncbi:MAG: DNA repair exonuclease [Clostridia bacterium]|nr:DNA repair exonuclease [Clostridia bacterium]
MIKILHTGDLHLGSPFSGLSPRESRRCRERQEESFGKMIGYAKAEGISLFLIAGDLFDGDAVSTDTLDNVFDALASLPCPVVIAPGNHDPYRVGSPYTARVLPENVYVFDSEALTRFSFPTLGVDVFGYAFTSPAYRESPLASLPDNFCLGEGLSILLAHGDLDSPLSRYAPIRSQDLARSGADYVALGHVHNAEDEILSVGATAYAYCGFPEGRSFDECGFGSFRVITLSSDASVDSPIEGAERVRCSTHRYESRRCDVTGCESDPDTAERIRAFLAENGFGSETTLRLTLDGEVSPRYTPDPSRIAGLLDGNAIPSPLTLLDRTLPVLGSDYLESDLTLRGELYRILKPKMLSGSEEERLDAALALRLGLAALDERPIL